MSSPWALTCDGTRTGCCQPGAPASASRFYRGCGTHVAASCPAPPEGERMPLSPKPRRDPHRGLWRAAAPQTALPSGHLGPRVPPGAGQRPALNFNQVKSPTRRQTPGGGHGRLAAQNAWTSLLQTPAQVLPPKGPGSARPLRFPIPAGGLGLTQLRVATRPWREMAEPTPWGPKQACGDFWPPDTFPWTWASS